MSYKYSAEWRTGKTIDEEIDRTIFELQAKNYDWKKTLSIKPRRCYWTGNIIRPFSYAMVCHPDTEVFNDIANALDADHAEEITMRHHVYKWITMESYIFLKLSGRLR